jgi:hypothetical protein
MKTEELRNQEPAFFDRITGDNSHEKMTTPLTRSTRNHTHRNRQPIYDMNVVVKSL